MTDHLVKTRNRSQKRGLDASPRHPMLQSAYQLGTGVPSVTTSRLANWELRRAVRAANLIHTPYRQSRGTASALLEVTAVCNCNIMLRRLIVKT